MSPCGARGRIGSTVVAAGRKRRPRQMERNLFQSLNVPLDDDDYENGNLSDEVELSDEDEWVPPCEESKDSESSDEGHTYTELAPANVNIAVPLDGTSNDPYEGEDATSSSNSIVLGKDKH
ncbi:hypothetical protein PoB_004149600 [Plakobranchus ocellatus]|uniref:Uncharacterized protein n=1 Tax=Plakobranchus ocellatus TaxID=259542 RepID=A0AAV4B3F0_9GAST|nr:hypothetical protein PoB_004149600 [Plakobranchus ocellatus]